MTMRPRVIRQFCDGPFGQVHVRRAGDTRNKPGLVCLHMSPKSGRSFADILPYLAGERRVLAPDNPGHGESDLPPAQPPVTLEDYARSMWAAVDQLSEGPVHLAGYHTGSMVAVEAASQRPEQVLGVINISAPVMMPEEARQATETYAPLPIDEEGGRFSIMWQRVLAHRGPGMTLQMAADSFAENLRAGDHYEWGHRAAFAYAATYARKLGEIEHPLLVINPRDDCWELSQRADALWNNGRRIDKPEWGHGFLSAFAPEAARLMLDFLEEIESAAA